MNDFLFFLNTANADSLTKISGIPSSLAENLIAARPFESIEDCLKVRGMGKSLLARAQASFEKTEAEIVPEEHALTPVDQEDNQEAAPIEKSQPAEETPHIEAGPSFSTRLGQAVLWFFRALLRLILIVLVIGGVGAAIYYGVPLINEKLVAPVEQNSARVNELQNEIVSLQDQLTEINSQLVDIESQLTEVNSKINSQSKEVNSRLEEIEQLLEAHSTSLEKLEEMQSKLETQLKESNDKILLELKHEVMMTRVLDMLARARLYLAQSNFGLAKEDVQSARALLADLHEATEEDVLFQAIERLDMVLRNLPEFPIIASGDLEITWQILMTGNATATGAEESTSTTTATPEGTVEPLASPTATP